MHLRLEDLLSVRDGESSPQWEEHLRACPDCRSRLKELKAVREALRGLPALEPPRDLWPSLRRQLPEAGPRAALKALWAAAAAAVLLGAVWLGLKGFRLSAPEAPVSTAAEGSAEPSPEEIAGLVAESQRLEAILKRLEAGAPVLKGSTAAAIAEIQDRIALVDLQISLLQGTNKDRTILARLWKERVGLLGSLVEMHLFRHAVSPA
ncbi:MAG: anti-sigma factor family protein [Acidobacteriota bacterium]